MSEAKHTPGPWKIEDGCGLVTAVDGNSVASVIGSPVSAIDITEFQLAGVTLTLTGSRAICPNACGENSDFDYVGLVENLQDFGELLVSYGWTIGNVSLPEDDKEPLNSQFLSLRNDAVNLLLTQDKAWHDNFLLATRVATKLGLTDKSHRILLFQALLYGNG